MKWANILVFLFVAQYGICQQAIQGKIVDATTQNAISGATIQIKDSSKGTTTDDAGVFVLPLTTFPVELIISYIGYETQSLTIEAPTADLLQIALTPSVTLLEEVIVSSESEEKKLSEFKEYSIKDFEIVDSQLLWIEYHGTFNADILTLADLEGQTLNSLKLKDINQIEGLFKSCNNQVYLLTKYLGYPITIEESSLSLGQAISIDTIDAYIKPCKVQDQDWLYYLFEQYNGQLRLVVQYNTTTEERNILRAIGDEQSIRNYRNDIGLISRGQRKSNIWANTDVENDRIRRLQRDSDFLLKVFYKPEFPVELVKLADKMLLFNHPEKELLVYNDGVVEGVMEIAYVLDKKWLKQLVWSESGEEVYGLFKHKKGVSLRKIGLETGQTELAFVIEQPVYKLGRVVIVNDYLYFSYESSSRNGKRMVLVRQEM